jgi:hypothetical protein
MSGLQRRITGSNWDHVAIVVPLRVVDSKEGGKVLVLLECTPEGVQTYPLESRLKRYAEIFSLAISVRKLDIKHASYATQCEERLRRFASKVRGKPYYLSLRKLCRPNSNSIFRGGGCCSCSGSKQTLADFHPLQLTDHTYGSIIDEPDDLLRNNQADGFFCSELVAAAFKSMFVLRVDRPTTDFWPGCFAEGGEVDRGLVEWASLSQEFKIDLKSSS